MSILLQASDSVKMLSSVLFSFLPCKPPGCFWSVRVTYRNAPATERAALLPGGITCLVLRTNSLVEPPLEIMGVYFHPISFQTWYNIIPGWFIYRSLQAASWIHMKG